MSKTRTYLKDYTTLHKEPLHLFPPSATGPGVKTRLAFRESIRQPCIILSDPLTGQGFKITAGRGPHGFSVTVARSGLVMHGDLPTVLRASDVDYAPAARAENAREVTLTVYDANAKAQAFKRWYDAEASEQDISELGETYRRRA